MSPMEQGQEYVWTPSRPVVMGYVNYCSLFPVRQSTTRRPRATSVLRDRLPTCPTVCPLGTGEAETGRTGNYRPSRRSTLLEGEVVVKSVLYLSM